MLNKAPAAAESARLARRLREIGTGILAHGLGLKRIEKMIAALGPDLDARRFLEAGLGRLGVHAEIPPQELDRIPNAGPCIALSNHPFGLLDGMLLALVLKSRRDDVKILANPFLARFEPLRELFFWVDPFGTESARSFNRRALTEAIRWVQEGHLLMIFPAGEVSHRQWGRSGIQDPVWHPTVARIQMRTKAPVLPLHVSGNNSTAFQVLGLLHPRLRTVMLARELLNKMDSRVPVRAGHLIQHADLCHFATPEARTAFFRLCSEVQGRRVAREKAPALRRLLRGPLRRHGAEISIQESILPPLDPAAIEKELDALPAVRLLAEGGDLRVLLAEAQEIPLGLREIGRLREETFRSVGEGTGKSLDLDRFDHDYQHLVLWDRSARVIAGAYRLGPTDLLGERGVPWYTSTLFRFDRRFRDYVTPGLELGRSFVALPYQRSYRPLFLLWQAIGTYCVRWPRYRRLFGPVSISRDYEGLSKDLILDHLNAHHSDLGLARFVRPKRPVSPRKLARRRTWPSALFPELGDVSKIVSEIEDDHKGVPVLLREYLKLGGRVLGFNIDPEFSDVLDGLILVDLDETEPKRLERYMGKEGAERFRAGANRPAGSGC